MGRSAAHRLVIRRIFKAQVLILSVGLLLILYFTFDSSQLGSLPFSLLAGALGGSIALVRRLPAADDLAIESMSGGWVDVGMPMLYGCIMAGVAFFLFMSGILTGDGGGGLFTSNLFPSFTAPPVTEGAGPLSMERVFQIRPESTADFGKLVIWSFISGYSEHFVQGVLGTLEERAVAARDRKDKPELPDDAG